MGGLAVNLLTWSHKAETRADKCSKEADPGQRLRL